MMMMMMMKKKMMMCVFPLHFYIKMMLIP